MSFVDVFANKVALWPVLASGDTWYDYSDAAASNNSAATADMVSTVNDAGGTLQHWAGIIVGILGVLALIIGVYLLVKMLMAKGRGERPQTSWALVIIVLAVGGMMAVGGFVVFNNMAAGLMGSLPTPKG